MSLDTIGGFGGRKKVDKTVLAFIGRSFYSVRLRPDLSESNGERIHKTDKAGSGE